MPFSPRRTLLALAVFSAVPLLAACPKKKEVPVVDAGPPPPPPEEAGTTVLVPVEEDAGVDAEADAAPPKHTGKAVPTNVARLKQCCAQLRTQARAMGSSPEAGMLLNAATQCDTLAKQAGTTGTAPELGVLKTLLAGRTIPPVCRGF